MTQTLCPDCGSRLVQKHAESSCMTCLLLLGVTDAGADNPTRPSPSSPISEPELAHLPTEEAGQRIGRYRLLQSIGEGGFGVVWRAEQEEPVCRQVALKIIKLGMDTKQFVARFEAERQALAMMEHPSIARVFDGGATESGRPYFVMELVNGIPITAFCDAAKLTIPERLELFIQVCLAVQHAHQKGVIHRDLKPSNILVGEQDGRPIPKIIDFGIAKAVGEELTDSTLFTQVNQTLGTPAYMSPEQAGLGKLDIDTRTDIYSLGVLLYELLTSRTPLESRQRREANREALFQAIREAEPLRLSICLATIPAATLIDSANRRREEPKRLCRLLRGDLDWITLRALEKDRARRYESANDLAADLRRHLDNEPVVARPPSVGYRLQKAWRRNRLLVGAAASIVLALAIGLVLVSRQAARARAAEKETRRRAYAAEVNLGQQALAENNLERAVELLRRQLPGPDEEDLRGFEWHYLWRRCRPQEKMTLNVHGAEAAEAVAFSPDGKLVAYGAGNVIVQETFSQRPIATLPEKAITLSFSPDGALFVTANWNRVTVWDARTWQVQRRLDHSRFPSLFSPDGAWLLTGHTRTNVLSLWNTRDWSSRAGPTAPPDFPTHVRFGYAFSPDGSRLVTPWLRMAPVHFGLRVWEFPSLQSRGDLFPSEAPLISAAFLPDSVHLLAGTFDGRLLVWELPGLQLKETWHDHTGCINSIAVSSVAGLIATASADRTVGLWDISTRQLRTRLRGHTLGVWPVAVSPDGKTLLSGALDGTAKLWDLSQTAPATAIKVGGLLAGGTPDGRGFVFGPQEGDYRWRYSNESIPALPVATNSAIPATTFTHSADVRGSQPLGALGRIDGQVEIWDLAARQQLAEWRSGSNEICVVKLAPDLAHLAVGNVKGHIHLWDISNRRQIAALRPVADRVATLAFSPDGRTLASASGWTSAQVYLWDVSTGRELRRLDAGNLVAWLAFSPDGRQLAVCLQNSDEVKLWELSSAHGPTILKGHVMGVLRAEFSPDGKSLATAGFDGKVKLWSLAASQEVLTLAVPRGGIFRSLSFSLDGATLAVGYLNAVGLTDAPRQSVVYFEAGP